MQMTNQVEHFADLLRRRSVFQTTCANGFWEYRIFKDVPVHCLRVKGSGIKQCFPHQVIDLLICRGNEAIQAVVFDEEYLDMKKLFSTQLQALPCEFLKSDELTDDLAEELCGDIEFRVRCDKSAHEHTGCTLHSITLHFAVRTMNEADITDKFRSGYRKLLEEKHLIDTCGNVSGYGRACGLFRCLCTRIGSSGYFTVPQAANMLKNAFLWHDTATADKSLAQRLSRLRQGLPCECTGRDTTILKQLLHTPLEKLFHNYRQDRHYLNVLLNHAQLLSRESSISAFGDKEDIETYGDVIYAVKNLWEYTAHEDCRNSEATELCEQLLTYLSFPLWSVPPADEAAMQEQPQEPETSVVRSLHAQLKQLHQDVFDFSLAGMQLSHYFYAAACLTESEYPLWLYKTSVQPWLGTYAAGDLCFAVAMQAVYNLSKSDDESKKADCFPLLYDILVEPVSGIV